jgi:hypothetical protein
MFRALLIEKTDAGQTVALAQLDDARLPEGDVTVRVEWSTLNYKDALAITGRSPVIRKFPMVPGIDLAGVVEASSHPSFRAGERVVLNGYGVGESHFGGLAERARVKGDWLVPIPTIFTTRQAMAIGTAGYRGRWRRRERRGGAPLPRWLPGRRLHRPSPGIRLPESARRRRDRGSRHALHARKAASTRKVRSGDRQRR